MCVPRYGYFPRYVQSSQEPSRAGCCLCQEMLEMMRFFSAVSLVLVVALTAVQAIDTTRPRESGTGVVLKAIAEIEQTGIFGSDNNLLRRIAYVETRDGEDDDTYPDITLRIYNGGIWAAPNDKFMATKTATATAIIAEIDAEFSISWERLQRAALNIPLYSAIAARLVLHLAPEAIPEASDIQGQAEFWATYYHQGDVRVSDFVASVTELQGNVLENAANEFYLGFAKNVDNSVALSLFITTVEPNPVNFIVEARNGFSYSGIAQHNSSSTVSLPLELIVLSESERDKGVRVKAEGNQRIVVYGLSYQRYTTDAFLALPCTHVAVDSYEYYSVSYHESIHGYASLLLLVACEDNTTVTLPHGTLNLQRQETYLLESFAMDLTGTKVVSDKPMSVFPGHQCTSIPADQGCCCDYIVEQVPPTVNWGRVFLFASFLGRSSGELVRVLTSQNDTQVVVSCNTFAQPLYLSLITAGQWEEILVAEESFCSIESDKPVLVMEFALSSAHDIIGTGDPFMVMVTPIEQYSNNYTIDLLPEFTANYVTLYVSTEFYTPEHITVDGMDLRSASWSSVRCSDGEICGYITRVELSAGEHSLSHTADSRAKFGVTAYGFFQDDSYGYPGGLQLIPVQLATVSFSEKSYTVLEGEELNITVSRGGNNDTTAVVLVASDSLTGTVQAGSDYKSVIEVLQFAPGEVEKSVTVKSFEDRNIEGKEYLELYLSSGQGVYLSPHPRAEIVIKDNDGVITLKPRYGSQLGGTPVVVSLSGEDQTSQFNVSDEITCLFDEDEAPGLVLDSMSALCVSPSLAQTGIVSFKIVAADFTAETSFTSVSFRQADGVGVEKDVVLFEKGEMITITWTPESILPILSPEEYTVDISLIGYDTNTEVWKQLSVLGSNLPNTGTAEVKVDLPGPQIDLLDAISVVVTQVSVRLKRAVSDIQDSLVNFLDSLVNFGKIVINATIRYAIRIVEGVQQKMRELCDEWSSNQPANIGQVILNRLPPCPRTSAEAAAPNSGLKKDNRLISFFHPGAFNCFRQRVTASSGTGGSGQQCCYKKNGELLVGPPSGGTVDRYSPDVNLWSFWKHQTEDVLPYIYCCKAGPVYSNCEEYYKHRPSDMRSLIPPPPPACFYGDPHIVTLDGKKYTFNGKGEYTLIETPDQSFILQGRMVQATDENGMAVPATTFSAIVAKENVSDAVQLELTENSTLIAIVDGVEIDFTDLPEQEFKEVRVNDLGNNTLSATFSSGTYMETKVENGIMSTLIVSLSSKFLNTPTSGLMGSFNGDATDDLRPKLSNVSLPLNAAQEEIHSQFGLTWIINSPSKSLFSYQPGDNWAFYYDPYFVPYFAPVFTNSTLEDQANELCEGDQFCLYDIAATGNVDIGVSTLQGSQNYEAIVKFSIPVVCDPPCENGVCVSNDTCSCASGYLGDRCTERVYLPCEENPCENGGTCRKFVLEYTCECLSGHSGSFCENEESSDHAQSAVIGGVLGGIAAVLLATVLVVTVIIAVVVVKRHRTKLDLQTDIPMKECSAYDDVTTHDAANGGQKQREANLYEPVIYSGEN